MEGEGGEGEDRLTITTVRAVPSHDRRHYRHMSKEEEEAARNCDTRSKVIFHHPFQFSVQIGVVFTATLAVVCRPGNALLLTPLIALVARQQQQTFVGDCSIVVN